MNDMLIQVICRTLAHSLWQGLVLALLTGLVILFTRKASSARRYNLFSALLVTFLVAVNCTWYYEASNYQSQDMTIKGDGQSISKARVDFTPEKAGSLSENYKTDSVLANLGHSASSFLQKQAPLIVGFWFLIFCYKCLETFKGLRHVHRIRNYQVMTPEQRWTDKVRNFQERLRIPVNVRLLESKLVTIPAVTGFFKPIILVPIGMLNNLPQEQVEAILLHELAHIRRADYLVNILQRFVEILFFFNPGVLWLSSLIKDERENCCDDIAVGITNNRRGFVEALVSFQEYNSTEAAFSLGIGGKKPKLLNRSKRLLYGGNQTLNTIEKSALSVCLLLLVVLTFAFQESTAMIAEKSSPSTQQLSEKATSPEPANVLYADRNYDPDEIPEGTAVRYMDVVNGASQPTYLFKSQDTLYQISGDIRLFKINGEIVPQENYKAYLPKIRSLMAAYREQEAKLTNYLNRNKATFTTTNTEKWTERRTIGDSVTTITTTTITTTTTSDEVALPVTTTPVVACVPQPTDTLTTTCSAAPVSGYSQLPAFVGQKPIMGQPVWPTSNGVETACAGKPQQSLIP